MRNVKPSSHSHAHSKQTPTVFTSTISMQAHAAAQRRRTEVRRKLEDLRFAAQADHHPYKDKS